MSAKMNVEVARGPVSLTVTRARPEDAAEWDEFVDRHAQGRFCHLWGFKQVLEETFGYRCVYLNIFSKGKRIGLFPSVVVRRGSGRLISQPFNEYGGPLTESLSTDEYRQLTRLLLGIAHEENCHTVEIRGGIGCEQAAESGCWVKHSLHSYAVLTLDEKDRLWRESLTYEARKGINRARKAGLRVEIRRGGRAVEKPFYNLYLVSMKRLGVPPHAARFFDRLAAALGHRVVAAWVRHETDPVAILLGVVNGQRIHIFVSASEPSYWERRPNDLAHWELISWASVEGLRIFDFGSARYPGQIHYKKKWGASFHEYPYYLIGPPHLATSLRIQTAQSSSRFMTVMANLWRWLVPLAATPVLGPPIRKYLTK